MKVFTTKQGLPVLYKHNPADGLFDLCFRYEFGKQDVKGLGLVPSYLYYIGTDKKTSAEINQEFYKLACEYYVNVMDDAMEIGITGLNENMPKALALLEDFIQNAKADRESYDKYVALVEKKRSDDKTNQSSNFTALQRYAFNGKYNSLTNTLSIAELKAADPQSLPDMIKGLNAVEHRVVYFGPSSEKELSSLIAKLHKTPKKFAPLPEGKPYEMKQYDENATVIAPYDAKNTYMLEVVAVTPPPANKGKYVKIKYVTMLKDAVVPTFIFFCNLPQWVKEPYRRYLENKIRENWDFSGTPINIFMREK